MEVTTEPRRIARLDESDIEALVAQGNEPGWLRQRRLAAWRAWERLPLPDPNTQLEWRRTDPSGLQLDAVTPLNGAVSARAPELVPPAGDDAFAAVLLLADGHNVRGFVRDDLFERGVRVLSFADALRQIPGVPEGGFMTEAVRADDGKFAALHGALTSGGAVVYVPRGVEIEEPLYVGQELTQAGVAAFPHLLVYAEEMSRVTVIGESYSAATGHALVVPAVEVLAHAGSRVLYVDLQRWGRDVYALPRLRSVTRRDAHATIVTIGLGSGVTKGAVACELVEPGSSAELLGLAFADGRQHFELDTLQRHAAEHTTSRLLFKTALGGASTVIGNGMVRIEPQAQKSDAYQENRNLLLSREARADPIPGLEILANDVRCSHGTTVGPIDDDQAFYLQCRGLPREQAERLIVRGFFQEVLDRIPAAIEPRLSDELERKIGAVASGSAA